jgi:hypothetical protein
LAVALRACASSRLVVDERLSAAALAFAEVLLVVIAVLPMSKQQITRIGNGRKLFTTYLLKVYSSSVVKNCFWRAA